jgi:hypothetical protein
VVVVCADVGRRRSGLSARLGGVALCSYAAVEREPALLDGFGHVFALDPPAHDHQAALLPRPRDGGDLHLGWGAAEVRFAAEVLAAEYDVSRQALGELYRDLRSAQVGERGLDDLLGADRPGRSPAWLGHALRVLAELDVVEVRRDPPVIRISSRPAGKLASSRSREAYERRRRDGLAYLGTEARTAA